MGYHTSVWVQVLCWLMREGEIDTFSRRTQIISIHPWSNIHYTLIKQSSLYSHHSWWVCLLLFYNTIQLWLLHRSSYYWYSASNLDLHFPSCLWYSYFRIIWIQFLNNGAICWCFCIMVEDDKQKYISMEATVNLQSCIDMTERISS